MAKANIQSVESDIYTAVLALAVGVVLATAVFVAVRCYMDYETIFKIIAPR